MLLQVTYLNTEQVAGNPVSRFLKYDKLSTQVLVGTTLEDVNFIWKFRVRREVRKLIILNLIDNLWYLVPSIPKTIQEVIMCVIFGSWLKTVHFYYFVIVAFWMYACFSKKFKQLIVIELAPRLYGLWCNVPMIVCQH